jgi:serine/threonine protein kinase
LQNHYVLNHPHVIKMKDVFVAGSYLNIVLELAKDGMLHDYVNDIIGADGVMREEHAR